MSARSGCPESWCIEHSIDDGMVLHESHDLSVEATVGGMYDRFTAHVVVERDDLEDVRGETHVRLELDKGKYGTTGGPMKPEEALALSRLLRRAAHVALGTAPRLPRPVAVQ
ncbi:hypothetical protein AB0C29_12245 [Actinoplanes sp. NPDC048791]|uniref:hypothetical protein n=1 Tax=Actinoplanes sp. NPDC048791 TaxID=3154623 RepID=UPI0033C6CC39